MNPPVWLFDLDNTLHNADAGVFLLINHAMTDYLAGRLNLSRDDASAIREDYWHRYGATLAGLQIHHPEVDIVEFLVKSHPMSQILEKLMPIERTQTLLGRLKGCKAVFSNGPSFYVQAVTEHLQIRDHFDLLAGTDDFGFLYKPNRQAYLAVCQRLEKTPQNCIMVDDNADNLYTAKQLGMQTVWFSHKAHDLPFVDCAAHDMAVLEMWAAQQGWLEAV
ncbi:pyrimidine 5'-nucleotidase [Neisseria iguanae]|uniref:Pyrimidine 5'-nucleotidase n=1 Tax=Neisseria iguanae TaxID=90242 RepID=A0A2P7TX78_9NEIS|nr:pyrimidine 5'-nucleotidase [Neisseria iguanae]PSJ79321.1 pyrimidine 5'-nucleotidase [Neisseria iguanae]